MAWEKEAVVTGTWVEDLSSTPTWEKTCTFFGQSAFVDYAVVGCLIVDEPLPAWTHTGVL